MKNYKIRFTENELKTVITCVRNEMKTYERWKEEEYENTGNYSEWLCEEYAELKNLYDMLTDIPF